MNTKGMKFLAVLAVLAMAFAAFAVVAPAETDDAATVDTGTLTGLTGSTETIAGGTNYYVTTNGSSTVTSTSGTGTSKVYVCAGATLTLTMTSNTVTSVEIITGTLSGSTITIGTIDATFTAASAIVWTDTNSNVAISGTSATIDSMTVSGTSSVKMTSGTYIVGSTAGITLGSAAQCTGHNLIIAGAKLTSATKNGSNNGKIVILTTAEGNDHLKPFTLASGIVEYQDITLADDATGNIMQIGYENATAAGSYTWADSEFANNNVKLNSKYGLQIPTKGTGASALVSIHDNTFTADADGDLSSSIQLGHDSSSAIVNNVHYSILNNTFPADSAYRDASQYKDLKIMLNNAKIGTTTSKTSSETNVAISNGIDVGFYMNGGSASIVQNLTVARLGMAMENSMTVTVDGTANLTITDSAVITSGTMIISEDATMTMCGKMEGSVTNNGSIVLESGADISALSITGTGVIDDETSESDMKEIIIGGDSEGKSTVYSANQLVTVSSEIKFWTLSEGSKVEIKGVLVIPEGTKLTVEADAELVIHKNAKLIVYGQLIIDKKTESAESAGKLTIDAGYVYVEGTVEMDGITSFENGDAIVSTVEVAESGLFTIGDDGTVTEANTFKFIVDDGGYLVVYGTMGSKILNSGSVTVDSDVAVTTSTTICNMAANAVVEIENYTVKASANGTATLTISDKDLVFLTYWDNTAKMEKEVILKDSNDRVVISTGLAVPSGTITQTDYSVTFSGLVVKSTVSSSSTSEEGNTDKGIYNGKQYSKALVVEGLTSVDYTYIGNTTGRTDLTAQATVFTYTEDEKNAKYCAVKVVGAILIGDNVTIANKQGLLTVTGTITNESSAGLFTNAAKITVSNDGAISLLGSSINSETGISAAKFVVVAKDSSGRNYRIYNYYSIDGALAVVNAEAVTNEIVVLGSGQTVSKSTELPAPVTLVVNTGADMKVKKDITLTIKDGATLKGEGTVNVDGTLYAEEKGDVKSALTIVADVKTEALDDKGKAARTGWIMWTNLAKALSDAEPGSIVTITKAADKFVTLSGNLTVPEGVTLELPENAAPLLLKNGVTLTVDGIIIVGSNIYAQQAFGLDAQNMKLVSDDTSRYSSAIVVNGAFISAVAVGYGDGYASTTNQSPTAPDAKKIALLGGNFIAGQGYITYNTVDTTLSSATTAPIAGAYYMVKDGSKTLNVISSLSYAAMVNDYIAGDIIIHGKVAASVVAFEETNYFSIITVAQDNGITAPTSTATGCAVGTSLSVLSLVLDGVTVTADSPVTGYIGDVDDTMAFTAVKGMTIKENDGKLYVTDEMNAAATGSSASVSSGTVYLGTSDPTFTYTGGSNNLLIEKGAKAVVEKVTSISGIRVEGTFEVPANKTVPVTNLIDLGTVTVAPATSTTAKGSLTVTNLYIGADAAPKDAKTFATAAFNGPVTLTAAGLAIVMGDAELDYDALTALAAHHATSFVIGDDVYYTVYAEANNVALSTYTAYKPLISEAVISAWLDENGYALADDAYIGTYDAVYAKIVTKIYSVTVITDSGIKSVAIDGIEMVRQSGTNIFTMGMTDGDYKDTLSKLKTGTYKITYTLYSTYQEDNNGVILYTADGTILKDMKFSASGASGYKTVSLQLNGTELIPEPVTPEEQQSEWTITTILLVILVILIAVMAVIVALRLNRS